MATLDFVFDLTEKLEKQQIEYFLVTLQRDKKESKVDSFSSFKNKKGAKIMCYVLSEVLQQMSQQLQSPPEKE